MLGRLLAVVAASSVAGPAAPAEYVGDLQSEVFAVAGVTQADIMSRGRTCMAERLASGVQGGELVISDGPAAVVARHVLAYRAGLVEWRVRSRVTFEAREGRFRITLTGVERFHDAGGWGPIGKWAGSGSAGAERALRGVIDELAACVRTGARLADF